MKRDASSGKPQLAKPIMCTLGPAELKLRTATWAQTLGEATVIRSIPNGVAVELQCDAAAIVTLRELMALEAQCCEWIDFDLATTPAGAVLTMRSQTNEGVEALRCYVVGERKSDT